MSSTLTIVNVMSWTSDHVLTWLKGLECMVPSNQELFSNASLNGKQLLQVTSSDLTRLGIHKIGHQESILLAISLLQILQYELSSETLLTLMLKLDSLARNLFNELKSSTIQSQQMAAGHQQDKTTADLQLRLLLSVRKDISDIIDSVKRIIRWIDGMSSEKNRKKNQLDSLRLSLLEISVHLLTYARSDTADTTNIMRECECLWTLCDQVLKNNSDSLAITPASLEIVTIQKRHDEDLGMSFSSSFKGVHTVESIKAGSSADQCRRLYAGDEIVQVNSKTVVGWTREQFVALLKENTKMIALTLRKHPQHMSLAGGMGGANRGVGGALKQLKGAGFPVQMSRKDKRRSQLLKHSPLVDTEPEPHHTMLSVGSATDYEDDAGSASDGDVFQESTVSSSRSRDMWRRMSTTNDMKQRRATVSGGSPTLALRASDLVDSEGGEKQSGIQTTRPKSYFPGVISSGAPIERMNIASQQKDSRASEESGSQSSSRKQSLVTKYSSEDDELSSVSRRLKSAEIRKNAVQVRIQSHPSETESEKEAMGETHVELRKKKSTLNVAQPAKPQPSIVLTEESPSLKKLEEDRNSGVSLSERLSDHESPWVTRYSSNSELISSGLNTEAIACGSDVQSTDDNMYICQSPKESGPRFSASPVPQDSSMLLKVPLNAEVVSIGMSRLVLESDTTSSDQCTSPKQGGTSLFDIPAPQSSNTVVKSPVDAKTGKKIDLPAQNISSQLADRINLPQAENFSAECCSLREVISANKPPLPIRKETSTITVFTTPESKSSVSSHIVAELSEIDERNNNELKSAMKGKQPLVGNLNTYQLDSLIYDKMSRKSPTSSSDSPVDSSSQHSRNTSGSGSYDFNIPPANYSFSSGSQRSTEATPTLRELTNPRRPSDYTVCPAREEEGFEHTAIPRRTSESAYKEILEDYDWSSPRLLGVMRIDSRKRGEMAQQEKLRNQAAALAAGGVADLGGAMSLSSRFSRQSRLSSSTGGEQSSVISSLPRTSVSEYDSDSLSMSSTSISSLSKRTNPMKKIIGVSRKISCKDLGGGDCRGWLWKKMEGTGLRPGRWVKFWFVLHHKNLFYFRDPEDVKAQGVLYLPGFKVSPDSRSKKFAFKVYNTDATFFFASESQEDMAKWMNKMGVASLTDFDIETVRARTTAGFDRPARVHAHASPPQISSSSSSARATMMSYFSESEDEGLTTPAHTSHSSPAHTSHSSPAHTSHSSPAQSTTGSREDLTEMYRHIRKADLDLSGSNVKVKRSSHLAGASFVVKPSKIGGVDRELYCKLLSLRRTLKDKENQLIPVNQLLSSQPITNDQLAEFQEEYSGILSDELDRTSRDGDSVSSD